MRIGDTNIHADRCVRGASAVLLTHYHRDHLAGVRRHRGSTPILCSPLTARLLQDIEGTAPGCILPLAPGEHVTIRDGVRRARVRALDANHCPGSLMFLVEWEGQMALYTGDFRLNDQIRSLAARLRGIDLLYLDATYDHPRYVFPPQGEAVNQVLSLIRGRQGRRVYLAVYSLGKNRLVEAAVRKFGLPFYTPPQKQRIYRAAGMGHLITPDRDATPFRAYGLGYLERYFRRSQEFRRGEALAIVPTGWAVERRSTACFRYVPYSEHCDYRELEEFRRLIRARRVVPIHDRAP